MRLVAISSASGGVHLTREPAGSIREGIARPMRCGRTLKLRAGMAGYGEDSLPALLRGPYMCGRCKAAH